MLIITYNNYEMRIYEYITFFTSLYFLCYIWYNNLIKKNHIKKSIYIYIFNYIKIPYFPLLKYWTYIDGNCPCPFGPVPSHL